MVDYARSIGADLRVLGRDFEVIVAGGLDGADGDIALPQQWTYRGPTLRRVALPIPTLRGRHQLRNAAGALAALEALGPRLPVSQQAVREGLLHARIEGRFQVLPGQPAIILDVAHNPQAAEALARTLKDHRCAGRTHAVFAMLRDKDVAGVAQQLRGQVQRWYLAPTTGARGLDAATLAAGVQAGESASRNFESISQALAAARAAAGPDDRILVFGSFVTVADAMRDLQRDALAPRGSKSQ